MESHRVIECNECRTAVKSYQDPSPQHFTCARCESSNPVIHAGMNFLYCPECSMDIKRCWICGSKVNPDGSRMIANYAPKSFREAHKEFLSRARPGDLVLAIVKSYEFKGCTGFGYEPKPRDYTLSYNFYLGVVPQYMPFSTFEGGDFGMIKVNFDRHVSYWGYDLHLVTDKNKPVTIGMFQVLGGKLGEPLYGPDKVWGRIFQREVEAGTRKPDHPLEIIVGQEAIEAYCYERYIFKDFYLRAIEVLDIPSIRERAAHLLFEKRAQIFKDLWRLYKEKDVRNRAIGQLLKEALELKMDVVFAKVTPEDQPWLAVDVSEFVKHLKKQFL